jgi:DNA invertase Pin-like site-specific DNA recombinase
MPRVFDTARLLSIGSEKALAFDFHPRSKAASLQFVDYATGKTGDRDQLQAMLRAAENHEFDELVVWSLDRLTREGTLFNPSVLGQVRQAR